MPQRKYNNQSTISDIVGNFADTQDIEAAINSNRAAPRGRKTVEKNRGLDLPPFAIEQGKRIGNL